MDTRLLAQRLGRVKAAVYVPCPAPNLFLAPVAREFQAVYHPAAEFGCCQKLRALF
jgi:hypothetical protein